MKFFKIKLLIINFLIITNYSCSLFSQEKLIEINGLTMGTMYSIKIIDKQSNINSFKEKKIKEGIEATLKKVNLEMSTFIDSSQISKFNDYLGKDWIKVSSHLAYIVTEAINISKKSDGYFDITVAPLINLWGFGTQERKNEIPAQNKIDKIIKQIGYQHLYVKTNPPSLKKNIDKLTINLSSIAKGFGVDITCEYLDSLNVQNYLVEIGGEIRVKGTSFKNNPWKIGIEAPDQSFGVRKILYLGKDNNLSVATSGDYWNYFEVDGKRYSHTINPKTGRPITHKLASVSVIHNSCMIADAFATAIDVLGPTKGLELANKENLAVYMIIKSENGYIEKLTKKFEDILKSY